MKQHTTFLIAGLLTALTACQTSEILDPAQTPQTGENPAALTAANSGVSNLVAKECAVYFAIEDQLEAEGRPANGKIYEGCPGGTSVGASIKPLSQPPSTDNATAKTYYRKLLARGTPKDIADQVSKSKAFQDWVNAAR